MPVCVQGCVQLVWFQFVWCAQSVWFAQHLRCVQSVQSNCRRSVVCLGRGVRSICGLTVGILQGKLVLCGVK